MNKYMLNNIQEILLMGPGPSSVSQTVYDALAKKSLGHLDPYFIEIMNSVKSQLQELLQTQNRLTLPASGTGSAGMETCFVNLIEKGDPVLILINGVFGMRMKDVSERLGADVDSIEYEWGTTIIVDDVKKKIQQKKYKIVAIVHAETSTGVLNPVSEIGQLLKGSDTLYLVDTVTSLGGMEVSVDKWGIDALYSGTQKCLSCPPGLSPVTFSERAIETIKARKTKVPNWYLDLSMIINYWEGNKRAYHHTAPINMIYGLHQALYNVLDEGTEKVFKRHMDNHLLLVNGIENMGLKMLVKKEDRLPMLNSVLVPDGVDEAALRVKMRNDFKIEIGAGLGSLAGKIIRIGLMGHTARKENVEKVLDCLKKCL